MEEKDDWTCGREGDRHPFTHTNLQDEFIPPILILRTYRQGLKAVKIYYLLKALSVNKIIEKFFIVLL